MMACNDLVDMLLRYRELSLKTYDKQGAIKDSTSLEECEELWWSLQNYGFVVDDLDDLDRLLSEDCDEEDAVCIAYELAAYNLGYIKTL